MADAKARLRRCNLNIQRRVEHFRECYGSSWVLPSIHDTFLFIVSEIGEISDVLLRQLPSRGDYFRMHEAQVDAEEEIGDAIVMLCTLASQLGIDVEKAVDATLEKIRRKIASENSSL